VDGSRNLDGKGGGELVGAGLSSLSAGNYYEKVCLGGSGGSGGVLCEEDSFELLPNRVLDGAREQVLMLASVSLCLEKCLEKGSHCASVMFFKRREECVLNSKSQFTHPELFHPASDVDYYDNLCVRDGSNSSMSLTALDSSPTVVDSSDDTDLLADSGGAGSPLLHGRTSMSIEDPKAKAIKGHHGTTHAAGGCKGEEEEGSSGSVEELVTGGKRPKPSFDPLQSKAVSIDTECSLGSVRVKAVFARPSTGSLFVKDHSATCSVGFDGARDAVLEIPFPSPVANVSRDNGASSKRKCPGLELSPNTWSFLVVVQRNNLGIASLMTGNDR